MVHADTLPSAYRTEKKANYQGMTMALMSALETGTPCRVLLRGGLVRQICVRGAYNCCQPARIRRTNIS